MAHTEADVDRTLAAFARVLGRMEDEGLFEEAARGRETVVETPEARAEREEAERLAILREMQKDLADSPASSYAFLAEKREEIEQEFAKERRWAGEE